jgi:signal transduction histidine kinase
MKGFLVLQSTILLIIGLMFPLAVIWLYGPENPPTSGISHNIGSIQDSIRQLYSRSSSPVVRQELETIAHQVERLGGSIELQHLRTQRLQTGLMALTSTMALVVIIATISLWALSYRKIIAPLQAFSRQLSFIPNTNNQMPTKIPPEALGEIRQLFRTHAQQQHQLNLYHQRTQEAERNNISRFVVHEVRNALTPLGLGLQMLKERIETDPGGIAIIQNITSALIPLHTTLEQLRQLYSTNKASLQPLSIINLIHQVLIKFPNTNTTQITVEHIGPPPANSDSPDTDFIQPHYPLDGVRFVLALENLIRNAIEACDPNPQTLQQPIAIQLNTMQKPWQLQVIDHGSGISPEHLAQLGNEYFSTKINGTGLGLAFARRMLASQNLSLDIDSVPGRGSVFIITFEAPPPLESEAKS